MSRLVPYVSRQQDFARTTDTTAQHQCIANLKAVLQEAGSSLEAAIEVNVFLSDIASFAKMNNAYAKYWGGDGHRPART